MSTCLLYVACDRTPLLSQSLLRLSERTVPDEVLVVDDGGTDPSLEALCQAASGWLGQEVRYLYTHNPGNTQCSHARNVGIHATDAENVLTVEPEMVFETDAVAQVLQDWREHEGEVISAGTILVEESSGGPIHEQLQWNATYIALYKRQWLLDIGGWDEGFPDPWGWDDVDLATRLRVTGHGMFIDPGIRATHLWHPGRWSFQPDQVRNSDHFFAKGFQGDERPDHPDLIANHGDWGVAIPRP